MNQPSVLTRYLNGNYQVTLYSDGTKVRITPDDNFAPIFPETLDVNISNQCPHGCRFCYIAATAEGKHGNLDLPMFGTLPRGTEIAINYADHPNLVEFLQRMEAQGVIVNMTVNAKDFNDKDRLRQTTSLVLSSLIKGVGVSITNLRDYGLLPEFIKNYQNTVYHIINGIISPHSFKALATERNKILILGYKHKGRGESFIPKTDLSSVLSDVISDNKSIISFDNLALEQLNVKSLVSDSVWSNNYMGEEGQFSMYLDTVSEQVYKSSTEPITNGFSVLADVKKSFNLIRSQE